MATRCRTYKTFSPDTFVTSGDDLISLSVSVFPGHGVNVNLYTLLGRSGPFRRFLVFPAAPYQSVSSLDTHHTSTRSLTVYRTTLMCLQGYPFFNQTLLLFRVMYPFTITTCKFPIYPCRHSGDWVSYMYLVTREKIPTQSEKIME